MDLLIAFVDVVVVVVGNPLETVVVVVVVAQMDCYSNYSAEQVLSIKH
jgi:hypothetical protein